MSEGRRLAGQTLVRGLAFILSGAVSFLLLPIYTRFLPLSEYGALDVILSLNRALVIPASLGIGSGLGLALQEGQTADQARRVTSAFVAQAIWVLVLIATLGAAAPMLAVWLFGAGGRMTAVQLGLSLLAAQVLLNFSIGVVNWKRESWRFFLLATGSAVASAGGSVLAVTVFNAGAGGALTGLLIGTALFLPLAFTLVGRHFAPRFSLADARRCLALGLPFALTDAAELVFPFLLRLILLGSAGLDSVGVFAAASTVCVVITVANYAFSGAWLPFALSAEGRRHRAEWPRVVGLYGLGLIGVAAMLALLAPLVVEIVLGGGVYERAMPLYVQIALTYWLRSMRQASGAAFIAERRSWVYSAFGALSVAGSVLLAWLLIGRYGVAGAAWGIAAGEAIAFTAQSLLAVRRGSAIFAPRSAAVMASSFILLAVATVVPLHSTANEILLRAAYAALFATLLLLGRAVPLRDLGHATLLLRSLLSGR